jgi:two-component system sensor histidine kinase KdpD
MAKTKAAATSKTAFDEQREQMHRQLFTAVSHDLKTPLSSMIGSLEIYQRLHGKLDAAKCEALIDTALQEAYRLDNFVSNILDMAKLESGIVTLRKTGFDLETLIRDCLTSLDNRLKGLQVTLHRDAVAAVEGTGDTTLICRALTLLIDNAVRYGGAPPAIDIYFGAMAPNLLRITVADNGKGVPAAQKEKVFEKYTRFAKSDSQNAGTGLGLPICRAVMKVMGGTVEIDNHHTGGARFTLLFPA